MVVGNLPNKIRIQTKFNKNATKCKNNRKKILYMSRAITKPTHSSQASGDFFLNDLRHKTKDIKLLHTAASLELHKSQHSRVKAHAAIFLPPCTGALPPLSTASIHPCNKRPPHSEPRDPAQRFCCQSDGTQMSWSGGVSGSTALRD